MRLKETTIQKQKTLKKDCNMLVDLIGLPFKITFYIITTFINVYNNVR